MGQDEFTYSAHTEKSFDGAVVSVLKSVAGADWSLFQVYDLRERLAAKGFEQKPLKVIEICKARNANGFLEMDRMTSLCMPCRINILQEEKVRIVAMRPSMMMRYFPSVDSGLALSIEKELIEIIEKSR